MWLSVYWWWMVLGDNARFLPPKGKHIPTGKNDVTVILLTAY